MLALGVTAFVLTSDIFTAKVAEGAWYSSGGVWTSRKQITVDPQKVGSTTSSYLNDFPMLVSVTDSDLKYTSFGGQVASSTGGDILFTEGDGATALNYEIESYASTTGALVAWVKIPFLSSTSTNSIYMYYGSATAPNVPASTMQNTWNSAYKGVWHLGEGTGTITRDSTATPKNGTLTSSPTWSTGVIGPAVDFTSAGYVTIADDAKFQIASGITTECWLYFTSSVATGNCMGKVVSTYSYELFVNVSNQRFSPEYYINSTLYYDNVAGYPTVSVAGGLNPWLNSWVHLVSTYDGATIKTYVNGILGNTYNVAGTINTNSDALGIGARGGDGSSRLNTKVDEVRISNTIRNADWVLTQYRNQSNPGSFYGYGAAEQESKTRSSGKFASSAAGADAPGWYATGGSWSYRKKISIDNQKVASTSGANITAFPMLLSVTDASLKSTSNGGKVGQADGGDIVFTGWNGTSKLSHEIEKYDAATGELVAWINIPFVSSTSTTPIYMYVGDGSIADQWDTADGSADVWDPADYKAVWHFNTDPTAACATGKEFCDTTSNNQDGDSGVTMSADDLVSGKMGYGLDFDGGAGDFLSVPDSTTLEPVVKTISLWFKSSSLALNRALFNKQETSGSFPGYQLNLNYSGSGEQDGTIAVYQGNGASWTAAAMGAGSLNNSTWRHVAVTYDGTSSRTYFDGRLVNTTTYSAVSAGAVDLQIARDGFNGNTFTGQLDEMRIIDVARSPDWMMTEYNNQMSPSTFYSYGADWDFVSGRVDSGGASVAPFKVRSGVKFR